MKAQDLRIGNFVKPVRYVLIELTQEPPILDCYFKVVGLGDDEIEIYNGDEDVNLYHYAIEDEIEPIKLTEDWLIKFGFEKVFNKHTTELEKGDFKWYSECGGRLTILIENDEGRYSEYELKCKYVHELQNLYHALTGEELTLKETK